MDFPNDEMRDAKQERAKVLVCGDCKMCPEDGEQCPKRPNERVSYWVKACVDIQE